MALVINTNVASLSAQNSMNKAQQSQNEAMERLTTGKRINTAADDAAGLAIANKMTSQVKGLNQAVRNANDGISMLQTAAGGLEESSNILQRMRELAVQSASGTYTEGNRGSMQDEVDQLKAELDRISETTTFNGQKILDGSQQDTMLQVGANANETISFSIGSTSSKELGGASSDISGAGIAAATLLTGLQNAAGDGTDDMLINGQNVGDLTGAADLEEAIKTMNDNIVGVEVGVATELVATKEGDGVITSAQEVQFTVTNLDGTATVFDITETKNMDEVVDQINTKGNGSVTASLNDQGRLVLNSEAVSINVVETGATALDAIGIATATTSTTKLTLDAEQGVDGITVEYTAGGAITGAETGIDERKTAGVLEASTAATYNAADVLKEGDLVINGVAIGQVDATTDLATTQGLVVNAINEKASQTGVTASFNGSDELVLTSVDGSEISVDQGDNAGASFGRMIALQETNNNEGAQGSVASIDISDAAGAQKAIEVLDAAIGQVSDIQGELGAVNNRLDFTVSNLSNVSENAAAAKSRIEDTDYAAESASLSRAQVLQQAGQAMLSQANSAPQQVLSLLQ